MARKLPEVEYCNAVHFHVQVVGLRAAIILVIISRLFISAVRFFGPNRQLLESHEALSHNFLSSQPRDCFGRLSEIPPRDTLS